MENLGETTTLITKGMTLPLHLEGVEYDDILYAERVSQELINEFQDKVYHIYAYSYKDLLDAYVNKFKERIRKESLLSRRQCIIRETIKEFRERIELYDKLINKQLLQKFIQGFNDKLNESGIETSKNIEYILAQFKNKLNWSTSSTHKSISCEAINEFNNIIVNISVF